MIVIAFSGHRPSKLGGFKLPNPIYNYICQQIEKNLKELKPEKIISGMALGVDQWAANIAIKMNIPFIAAIPFIGQEKIWAESSKQAYHALLNKASEQVIVSKGEYSAYKLQIRNEWMVDHCDKLIAVWDQSEGGTGNCIKYANSINREIILIDPRLDKLKL